MERIVNLFMNHDARSRQVQKVVTENLLQHGYTISRLTNPAASYNIVIGGDGAFLRAVHQSGFSSIPFVGVNTGHLGFYQEIDPDQVEKYLNRLYQKKYSQQRLRLLHAEVETSAWTYRLDCINEISARSSRGKVLHLNVSFDSVDLATLVGDGVILSTPSGSTAYSLSGGGSILFQTLDGYQFTAMAPVRSSAFSALPASVVVPSTTQCALMPVGNDQDDLILYVDGMARQFPEVHRIRFFMSDRSLTHIIFRKDWYWENLKEKFI